MAIHRAAVFVVVIAVGLATGRPISAQVLDRHGFRLVFDDHFAEFRLRSAQDPDGRWDTKFASGDRTLPANGEEEIYVDPDYLGLGLNPFSVANGMLTITARPAGGALRQRLGGHDYISGLLTTEHSFAQTYGYFELRAHLPAGKGLWPAFWLLPLDGEWPPEIDVFEVVGQDPSTVHMTVHSKAVGTVGFPVPVVDTSAGFHDFGVLWGKSDIRWYVDGVERAHLPTPSDMHKPMYLLINLAVGGKWAGEPDGTTEFPAEFKIAYVRAYATAETIPAIPEQTRRR